MTNSTLPDREAADAGNSAVPAVIGPSRYMLLGLGLATWMEFHTYDGVNLVLPDMAGTLGLSQDQASWILTTYLSALLFGVPVDRAGRTRRVSSLHHWVHSHLCGGDAGKYPHLLGPGMSVEAMVTVHTPPRWLAWFV